MGVVLRSGSVQAVDTVKVTLPARPHRRLERVYAMAVFQAMRPHVDAQSFSA